MAYTIISQNNSTTTLSDGVNTITVPSRVNLTSGNFTIVEVNNNMATLEDGDGNVYRDIPCVATLAGEGGGGGGVSSVNGKTGTVVLNAADVSAVPQYSSMPVATADDEDAIVQYTGATDANYTHGYIYENVATTTSSSATASQTTGSSLSDVAVVLATFETQITTSGSYAFTSDGTNWSYDGNTVDLTDYGITYTGTPVADNVITVVYTESSTTYAWTRIDVQPSPNPLPSQTGNSGKFLTTDGTDASWSAISALQNTATGTDSLTILGTPTSVSYGAINIGPQSICDTIGVALGRYAEVRNAYNSGVAVGNGSQCHANQSVVIGNGKVTGKNAIQLGCNNSQQTNSNANTFKVCNANGNFEIMSADGTIPTARLTKVNTAITLAAVDWSSNTQTVTVNGVTSTSVVFVAPDPADTTDYVSAGILCTSQTTNSLTFTATTTPTSDIAVNVVCL